MGRTARRPCIEAGCTSLAAPGASRCPGHQRQLAATRNARRRSVPGDGAAARLRGQLNRAGAGTCGQCGHRFPAHQLEVDHRLALADGGTDTTPNVWLLCHQHHVDKTNAENRARAARPDRPS